MSDHEGDVDSADWPTRPPAGAVVPKARVFGVVALSVAATLGAFVSMALVWGKVPSEVAWQWGAGRHAIDRGPGVDLVARRAARLRHRGDPSAHRRARARAPGSNPARRPRCGAGRAHPVHDGAGDRCPGGRGSGSVAANAERLPVAGRGVHSGGAGRGPVCKGPRTTLSAISRLFRLSATKSRDSAKKSRGRKRQQRPGLLQAGCSGRRMHSVRIRRERLAPYAKTACIAGAGPKPDGGGPRGCPAAPKVPFATRETTRRRALIDLMTVRTAVRGCATPLVSPRG